MQKHGSLESAILSTLWKLEDKGVYTNTVKDVFTYMNDNIAPRAYTTIKTVMDRLCEKHLLVRYRKDKKFFYRSAYTNQEIIVKSLNEVANRYCNGNLDKLSNVLDSIIKNPELVEV